MKSKAYINILFALGIVLFVNIIGQYLPFRMDLTEEKRFSLTDATTNLLENLDDKIVIKVLLEGKFPASFKRLQQSTKDMLTQFRNVSSDVEYYFDNPTAGTTEEANNMIKFLAEKGIIGRSVTYFEGKEKRTALIYPYAIVQQGERDVVVNLLETVSGNEDEEMMLNRSISLMEYKLANAIEKLTAEKQGNILLATGHGELEQKNTISLERELGRFYNVGRIPLDSMTVIGKEADLLIMMHPRERFDDKQQFVLDQYIMNGGKVIWLIDRFDAHLDSIQKHKFYVPTEYELGLEDLWFKHGVRFQPNLLLDLQSSAIPQVIGRSGNRPQTQLFPWYYHPLVAANDDHVIVKNLDRVNMYFPSSIDTIRTKTKVDKTILLATSEYSRYQLSPVRLNFEILKMDPDPTKFNKGRQAVAVLLEGQFPSLFENRVNDSFLQTLEQINQPFKSISEPTMQLFVSDSDFAANWYNERNGETYPMGYNQWMPKGQNIFGGNQDFMLSAIEYMLSGKGVLEARNREVKLRLLNGPKVIQEKSFWQWLNLLLPVILIALIGLIYNFFRRRKYAS